MLRTYEIVHTVVSHVNAGCPSAAEMIARQALERGQVSYQTTILEDAETVDQGPAEPAVFVSP